MRRDAGQVVGRDAVTHIDKYIGTAGATSPAVVFLCCLGAVLSGLALFTWAAPWRDARAADDASARHCQYSGAAYSLGSAVVMGNDEKVCALVEGMPTWKK